MFNLRYFKEKKTLTFELGSGPVPSHHGLLELQPKTPVTSTTRKASPSSRGGKCLEILGGKRL